MQFINHSLKAEFLEIIDHDSTKIHKKAYS